jgi:hypothetical protein
MTIPNVAITKADGNTGVVRPSSEGVLAIIGPAQSGTNNQPTSCTRQDTAFATFGYGKLVESAAYALSVANKPLLLIKAAASVAAALGTVAHSGAGTSVVTVSGTPLDDFDLVLKITLGGTIGTGPISLQTSIDGGRTFSAVVSLGTANSYLVPNTGVTFNFAAGTTLAGQTESVTATGAKMNNADLTAALEALRTYAGPWEMVLAVGLNGTATELATSDAWLALREAEGKFRLATLNNLPRDPATQTEAQYLTAQTTAWASAASIRVCVGADQFESPSLLRGTIMKFPTALGVAARAMKFDISRDPAFVADGPVAGASIVDERNNPKFHDEALYPGLDDIRLTTLRSFDGRAGAYINNALLMSPVGSDYVYLQHARVMNRACELVFQTLTTRLSQGVRVQSDTGFILEEDAQDIEGLVNAQLTGQLVNLGRVSAARIVLSRTDDLRPNSGATITCELQVSALRYVKKFNVTARFVRTIQVNA